MTLPHAPASSLRWALVTRAADSEACVVRPKISLIAMIFSEAYRASKA